MCLKITCIIFHKIFHLNDRSRFNGRVAENLEFKSFMSCKVTKTGNIHNCFWAQSNAFPLAEPPRSPRSSKKVVPSLTEPANRSSLSGQHGVFSPVVWEWFPLPSIPSSHLCDPISSCCLWRRWGVGRGSPLAQETTNVTVALLLCFHQSLLLQSSRAFEREMLLWIRSTSLLP